MERNFRPAVENLYFMGNFSIYFTLVLKTITPTYHGGCDSTGVGEAGGSAGLKQCLCLPEHPRARLLAFPWEKIAQVKKKDRGCCRGCDLREQYKVQWKKLGCLSFVC